MQIENNAYPWRVATNRHTNTDGTSWGWIDGAPGNVCWSNERGSNMNREQAGRIVAEHNDWLEKQTPVGVRLLKAKEKAANIATKVAEAEAQTERLRATLRDAETAIATLEDEQAQAPNVGIEPPKVGSNDGLGSTAEQRGMV